jgi:hypothetical protein
MNGDTSVHRIGALERLNEAQSRYVQDLIRAVDKLEIQVEAMRSMIKDVKKERDDNAAKIAAMIIIQERHAIWVKALSVFAMSAVAAAGAALWSAISTSK